MQFPRHCTVLDNAWRSLSPQIRNLILVLYLLEYAPIDFDFVLFNWLKLQSGNECFSCHAPLGDKILECHNCNHRYNYGILFLNIDLHCFQRFHAGCTNSKSIFKKARYDFKSHINFIAVLLVHLIFLHSQGKHYITCDSCALLLAQSGDNSVAKRTGRKRTSAAQSSDVPLIVLRETVCILIDSYS